MKFTIEEFLSKFPLPADDKWKDGVFDVKPFKRGNFRLVFFARAARIIKLFTKRMNFILSCAARAN